MLQYAITDRHFFPGDERQRRDALTRQAVALSSANVDFLQLREKDLSTADLLSLCRHLRSALPGPTRLLLNGSASIAAEAGATGVHLPGGWRPQDLSAARIAFQRLGCPDPVLSVSAHTLPQVEAAHRGGASLILFGPIFEKRVRGEQVQPGIGLTVLGAAARLAGATPLLALGGITPGNLASCLAAGARGIAGIRLFLPPAPPISPPRQTFKPTRDEITQP